MVTPPPLTNSQVNKAGKALRAWWSGKAETDDIVEPYRVLVRYRAAHQLPLTKATMGLRSMVTTEGCKVEVSQTAETHLDDHRQARS